MDLLRTPKGRVIVFTLLYLSEGAPIGFIWWALPTLLRVAGLPLDQITALPALLILPWALKFLWAPLVDGWRSPRWGFRAWIMGAQLLMGLVLLPLMILDPAVHLPIWTGVLLVHALAAATQDVAVDALAIHAVPEKERGRINGCMQAGMLLGRSLFAGGTLWLAEVFGHAGVLAALVCCIWSTLFLLFFIQEPITHRGSNGRFAAFKIHLIGAMQRRSTWLGLGFALSAGAAFEASGALAGPFLIDHGLTQQTIGTFLAFPVLIVTMAGGLIGGPISDRVGRTRTVGLFLAGFVAAILALAAVDHFSTAPSPILLLVLLTVLYLFIGLFTAASYALFMDLTDPSLGATQFSTFMAATNGCESWSGRVGGLLAAGAGYPMMFLIMSGVSLLSLMLLPGIRKR